MPRDHVRLSRRQLLRGLGALGAAGLLAACGRGTDQRAGGTTTPSAPPTSQPQDPRQAIREQLGIEAPLDLSVVLPGIGFLTGPDRRLPFSLGTSPADLVLDLDVTAHLVSDAGLEVVEGPVGASFHQEGLGERGIYVIETNVEQPGNYWLVAESPQHAAIGALRIHSPDDLGIPDRGEPFPSVATPTIEEQRGLEELCTRDPDCSMHDVSLDTALSEGRPTVLTIATPAYCQTAICGPVVDIVEGLKQESDRPEIAWIHVEVFSDAGNTPVELVSELRLPSEPWTYFIDGQGQVADLYEGPTPADLLRGSLEEI